MRILISIFTEDHDTDIYTFKDSKLISTDWSIEQIDNYLELYDGFHSDLYLGDELAFWDIYCYFTDPVELSSKLEGIPEKALYPPTPKYPFIIRVREFDPGTVDDAKYPTKQRSYFLSELRRYECGCSSYSTILYWASTHPIEMVFIGGAIYDFIKWLIKIAFKPFGSRLFTTSSRPIILNTKHLSRNFEQATKIQASDFQIIKFKRLRTGFFNVIIRTTANEKYKIKCLFNGKIKSIELINHKMTQKYGDDIDQL